jgi:hypothetical protein
LQKLEEFQKKGTEVSKIDEFSPPTKNNLMKYSTPIITEGLAEVSKIRKKNAFELLVTKPKVTLSSITISSANSERS